VGAYSISMLLNACGRLVGSSWLYGAVVEFWHVICVTLGHGWHRVVLFCKPTSWWWLLLPALAGQKQGVLGVGLANPQVWAEICSDFSPSLLHVYKGSQYIDW
jgi:hypothetical protein